MIEGSLCWHVRSSDAESLLVMIASALGSDEQAVFLALAH
jgi:hypothetical protein